MKELVRSLIIGGVLFTHNHALGVFYIFSAVMSKMPELPENAGWWTRWLHDGLQFIAANPGKFSTRRAPAA